MKIVIIDDEEKARKAIGAVVDKSIPEVAQISFAHSVSSGIKVINELDPDLVLLDIKMPDGSGFDLLEQLAEISFDVIFITAFEEYAIKAFECSALHYLLKPLDSTKLSAIIAEVYEKKKNDQFRIQFETAADIYRKKSRKIILKTLDSVNVIVISDVVRCEADINYTHFFFKDGKQLLTSRTLKEFEMILKDYGFFRTHKSHLINMSYLKKIERKKHHFAILSDGSKVPVALRKREILIKVLENNLDVL